MNCNACIKLNPIPNCIDTEGFLLTGLSFEDYASTTITGLFRDTATDRTEQIDIDVDGSGLPTIDIGEFYELSSHLYEIKFIAQDGTPANFLLTNPDATTDEGCCIEFTTISITGSTSWALSSQTCAVQSSSSGGSSTCDNCLTDDQYAAIPSDASGTNPLVTEADISGFTVGGSYFMAENFANNETLGDGSLRTLASLGYDDSEAAGIWTRVAGDVRFTIDVNTMTIDWIAWQEAMIAMQEDGYSAIVTPGGRGYCPNQKIYLPREQFLWTANRRSKAFDFDFKMSRFNNLTGTSFIMFDRYPENHTEATSAFLDYRFMFSNAYFEGNDSTDEDDCFIRLGATNGCTYKNIEGQYFGLLLDHQFGLQANFQNINGVGHGKYIIAVRDGIYSGSGEDTDQSNNIIIDAFRSVTGTGKTPQAGIYFQGNRNIKGRGLRFEGDQGSVHHILYEQEHPTTGNPAGTVKNCMSLESLDFENAGASRAAIKVHGGDLQVIVNEFNIQATALQIPVFFETEFLSLANYCKITNAASDYTPEWKFRQSGGLAKWVVEDVRLQTNGTFADAANWDLTLGGVLPSDPSKYRFTPAL